MEERGREDDFQLKLQIPPPSPSPLEGGVRVGV